jgi:hypothetical protein
MSATSWPRTVADALAMLRALAVHPEAFDPACRETPITAPCCGRRTPADTVIDVSRIPGTIVRGGGHRAPADHDWLCDGCMHRLVLDDANSWSYSRLFSALGAPAETVRRHHARELAAAQAVYDFTAIGTHRPGEALVTALASLPAGVDPHRRRTP